MYAVSVRPELSRCLLARTLLQRWKLEDRQVDEVNLLLDGLHAQPDRGRWDEVGLTLDRNPVVSEARRDSYANFHWRLG